MKHAMSRTLPFAIFMAAVMLSLAARTSLAREYQDPQSIKQTIREFVLHQTAADSDNIEVSIGTIDPRLRLQRCDQSLEAYKAPGGHMLGNTSIGVSCNGISPWKLYVPVKISVYEKVLVAKRYLRRGSQISADDVALSRRDLSTLNRGYIIEPQQAVGLIPKQPILAEDVIRPSMIEAQKLVRRGENVIILAKNKGFEVRMKGKALGDGISGQIIQVQNLASQRVIQGEVISRGVVSVAM